MKQKIVFASALVLIGATISGCASLQGNGNLFGDPATPAAASRTIVIAPDADYVNVTHGEIIKFVSGNKTFAWDFDSADNISSFSLNKVAPAGTLDHNVQVYIARDPMYDGGA